MAPPITYRRLTISENFRLWLLDRFQVQDNSPEWKFLYYALLGEPDDIGLPIPREELAKFESSTDLTHYVAEPFLEKMRERFPELQIDWTGYIVKTQVRRLLRRIPEDVQAKLDEELKEFRPSSERVYAITGRVINKTSREAEKRRQLEEIEARNTKLRPNEITTDEELILNYLNGLTTHPFTKILNQNLEPTIAFINQHFQEGKLDQAGRERELNILEKIELQPQQLYTFSEKTIRLAPYGTGICSLRKEVRRILTKGWIETDLKNCGFAINAVLWGLPKTQAFLEKDDEWWEELFNHFGMERNEAMKKRFKTATYALSYGATKETIRDGQKRQDGTIKREGLGPYMAQFFKHPIVHEMWVGLKPVLRKINVDGGMDDAYGNWIAVTGDISKRSVLAQVNQSYEQLLIAEVFKLAANTDQFTVCLYQSDGVSLSFRDKKRPQTEFRKINERVKRKAKELGVKTELL